jgi:hypothetical protein
MTNSKLIQLLSTFSKDEFRSFGKFVSSPFFHKDKAVIKLYSFLKGYYPEFSAERLSKESLFKDMYPSKSYSDSHMKYLMSELFRLGKEFLVYTNYNKDSFGREIRLLNELNSRNVSGIFESRLGKLESSIEKFTVRNEEYFHSMYKLKELVSDFYSYKDRLSSKREPGKVIENIINSFLLSLLDTYYELSNDAEMFSKKIDLELLNYVTELMMKYDSIIDPVVHIYYNILMLSLRNEEIYYSKLIDLKREYMNKLDDNGKHRIFEALGNYCIKQYQQGQISYYREAFNIFNDEIIHGVRFSRKEFSEIFFTNKVEIASKIHEFKWAYDFIEKYQQRLNHYHREDIVYFSYAIVEFESKNFTASLEYLAKVNLNHPLLRFRIRNYTLLNYYELYYTEQAFSLIDTYRHMLTKDSKIEESRKERYIAFLSLYTKLLEIKSGNKKIDRGFLEKEICLKSVFMKAWLLEKASEL